MICVEGKPDKALCEAFGISKKLIRDEGDKGQVCKTLAKSAESIGIVDEDPNTAQPGMLKYFVPVSEKYNVRYLKGKSNNKLIVIKPRLEGWVLAVCKQHKVDVATFNLPSNEEKLHSVMNSKLEGFSKLIDHLLQIEAPEILYLQSLLKQKK